MLWPGCADGGKILHGFVSKHRAVPCREIRSRMHASTDADIQLCRVGSLSSVNSLARDPMVAEASFRTPKKVVSAPVLLAQSVECGLH